MFVNWSGRNEYYLEPSIDASKRFQRRRFKWEKLTNRSEDGRQVMTKAHMYGIWPGELKITDIAVHLIQ